MVVQENIRKIAITEEQLASLKEAYIKQVEIIKAQSEMVATETIASEGVEPAALATAEVLESVNEPTENLVSPFANDNIGSTNIFDTANVAEPSVEAATADIFSNPALDATPTFEASSNVQEVEPIIESPVVEEATPAIEKVEVDENLDSILDDINKMQEEFADLNVRMIRFGNSIDELLERIKIYLNSKTLSNNREATLVVEDALKSSEGVVPTVESQINPVNQTTEQNVEMTATPNFDAPVFDEGVNIFDQPSSFVR